jgi:hypothetical protein
VLGYPIDRQQKDQTRSIIKTNAARVRWLKSATLSSRRTSLDENAVDSRVRRTKVREGCELIADSDLPDDAAGKQLAAVARLVSCKESPSISLPPTFYLDAPNILTRSELWASLQTVQNVLTSVVVPSPTIYDPIVLEWMRFITSNSSAFYPILAGVLPTIDAPDLATERKYKVATHEFYSKAVASVKENLLVPATSYSEANIMAVGLLGAFPPRAEFEAARQALPQNGPSQGPLTTFRDLEMITTLAPSTKTHFEAVERLVDMRGGLQTLSMARLGPGIFK